MGDVYTPPGVAGIVNGLADRIRLLEVALAGRGGFQTVKSSAVEGPSTVGSNLLYASIFLDLAPGTWAIYGQATMISQTAADGKQLALWSDTTGAVIPGSRGPVSDVAAVNTSQAFTTLAVVTLTTESVIRLYGIRNGGSQVVIGYSASLVESQRLTAIRLA